MQPSFPPLPLLSCPEHPSNTNTHNTPHPITGVVPSVPTKPTCWVTAPRIRSTQTKKRRRQGEEITPPPATPSNPQNDSPELRSLKQKRFRPHQPGRRNCRRTGLGGGEGDVQGPVHHMTVKEDQSRRGIREKGGKGAIAMATAPPPLCPDFQRGRKNFKSQPSVLERLLLKGVHTAPPPPSARGQSWAPPPLGRRPRRP